MEGLDRGGTAPSILLLLMNQKRIMTICELVIGDIKAREKLGLQRYGGPMKYRSAEVALQEAYEECLDQAIYLKQALESFNQKKSHTTRNEPLPPEDKCFGEDRGERASLKKVDTDICRYCQWQAKTNRGRATHEARCRKNPEVRQWSSNPPKNDEPEGGPCKHCNKKYKFQKALLKHEEICLEQQAKEKELKHYRPPPGSYKQEENQEPKSFKSGPGKILEDEDVRNPLPEVIVVERDSLPTL